MDVDKLEKELVTMVEDDKLYWLRNDAKFRAAKDQVSYDEFEQRVKVSIINSFWNRITKNFKDFLNKIWRCILRCMLPKMSSSCYLGI